MKFNTETVFRPSIANNILKSYIMEPTQRIYREFYSKSEFRMYQDSINHECKLINEQTGEEVKSFLANASFTEIEYRFWDKSQITLKTDQFYKIDRLKPL